MFAAGKSRQPEAPVVAGTDGEPAQWCAQTTRRIAYADSALCVCVDWLQVGTSFKQEERKRENDDAGGEAAQGSSELALQVYRKGDSRRKSNKKEKKKKKDAHRTSHKRRRRERESSSRSDEDGSDDSGDDGKSLALRRKPRKKSSKEKSSSRRNYSDDSSSDGNGSDGGGRSRRHDKDRKHKRLREESSSRQSQAVVVTAPKEVQVWMAARQTDGLDANGSKLFEFDCAGDKENRFYGTLYAHEKPLYTLATRRNVCTGEWIVERKKQVPGSDANRNGGRDDTDTRYFGARARKIEKSARRKRLYLAYSEKRLARQQENRQANSGSTPAELSYIPLDPVIDESMASAAETAEDCDAEQLLLRTETANVEQYLVARTKLLSESLQKNPRDVATWLDFVAFQEHSLRLNRNHSMAALAMVTEKQCAILEKALQANPACRELQLVKLNLSIRSGVHHGNSSAKADYDTIRHQLEKMIEADPTNGDLWEKLLHTRQQNFASFSIPSLRELYARILAILRKDASKVMHEEALSCASSKKSSVQIFEHASLLATSDDPYDTPAVSSTRMQELVALLLDFHWQMCRLEQKAGYSERSVSHLQALIEFNANASSGKSNPSSEHNHADMLQDFSVRWNQDFPRYGDTSEQVETDCSQRGRYLPSMDAFVRAVQQNHVSPLHEINPPVSIRLTDHQKSLAMLSSMCQGEQNEQVRRFGQNGDEEGEDGTFWRGDEESPDEILTYSNVHGYRIKLDEIDDASEYERILSELRGTESSIARRESQQQKEEKRVASIAKSAARFHDQRTEYDGVDDGDEYVQWLRSEETKEVTQWIPLRSANPLHQELIDDQPDRAVLTEEIEPFVFRVPKSYRWTLICNLLRFAGVHWSRSEQCDDAYSDDFEECGILISPILSAMKPTSCEPLSLSPQQRRAMLEDALLDDVCVKEIVLVDPSKVEFIRNVFIKYLNALRTDRDVERMRLLKYMWIGFETQIVSAAGGDTENCLRHARQLCQQLMESEVEVLDSTAPRTDLRLLFAYARLELKAGNLRQVNRICDKTLQSLRLHVSSDARMDRSFHCLIFLRARSECWKQEKGTASRLNGDIALRKLKTLYILWSVWQPDWHPLEKLEKQFHKQPKKLERYLENVLDDQAKTELVGKYRLELEIASQQSAKESELGVGSGLTRSASYCIHNVCLAIYAVSGFHAACNEYQLLLHPNERPDDRDHFRQNKWSQMCYLEFIQQHQVSSSFPIVAPRNWRHAVGRAVELCPHDPLLLRLFIDAETSNTMSQSLRQYFYRVKKRWQRHFDSPMLMEWLFALLCEFCRIERSTLKTLLQHEGNAEAVSAPTCCLFHNLGSNLTGIDRVRRLFHEMVDNIRTQGNALCWRLYLRFEVALGKIDSARKIFYRGLARCPWSKALYLDGIRVLRPYLSEEECKELIEFMAAKELHVREDI